MSDILVGALSLLLATNQPAAVSHYFTERVAPLSVLMGEPMVDPADPVEIEFQDVLKVDDAGEAEMERVLLETTPPDLARAETRATLREAKRKALLQIINRTRDRYEVFLKRHPDHVRARLAYGDHLSTHGEDSEVLEQLGIALKLDPRNPVVWNNYAGHFAHVGPITNAFHAYEQALALRPFEPLYHYNFGTVVFLYRADAMDYYHCNETAVFERALDHYRECRRLAPNNFRYAFEYAQTFYGVKPEPADTPEGKKQAEERLAVRALKAWDEALVVANNETDRDGIFLHFARWQIKSGRWEEARANLARVTLQEHAELKRRLERNLVQRESGLDVAPDDRPPIEAPKLELKPVPAPAPDPAP